MNDGNRGGIGHDGESGRYYRRESITEAAAAFMFVTGWATAVIMSSSCTDESGNGVPARDWRSRLGMEADGPESGDKESSESDDVSDPKSTVSGNVRDDIRALATAVST